MNEVFSWVTEHTLVASGIVVILSALVWAVLKMALREGRGVELGPFKLTPRASGSKNSAEKNSPPANGANISGVTAGRDAYVAGRDLHLSYEDRRQRAERKTDEAREKVREWGQRVAQSGWDEQAWHSLGWALQFAHEALENDSAYQRSWTLLADIYHRLGKSDLARECLQRSKKLATPGPHHPGRFYKEVSEHIETGYPFNSRGGLRRQKPPEWFDQKFSRYWDLPTI